MDGQEERRLLDKKNGVYCLFPGCPRTTTLTTLRFKDHFKAKHLTEGETYTTRHRDEYERACRDSARVDTPEGARIYLIELLEAASLSYFRNASLNSSESIVKLARTMACTHKTTGIKQQMADKALREQETREAEKARQK
ncbi:hypothetical protein PC122_g2078 [Phytophthora cactorum]|nr:hypothetical protein PC122_g2078 [Phytophthora cactorum]